MSSSFKEINKTESLTSKEQQEQHINIEKTKSGTSISNLYYRAVFAWLSKGIGFGFGFGFGFTTPFGWLVYLLWFWFYDSQVKTALYITSLKT